MKARRTIAVGLMAGALCVVPAASSLAYGPSEPGPTPPGFGPTLTACDTDGGGSCTGNWENCHIKVVVPANSFAHKVTVVISKIKNSSADKHLSKGHSSVCAFGVGFFRNGHQVHIAPGKPPAKLTITGDVIQASDQLFVLIPGGAHVKDAKVSRHLVVSTQQHLLELAVVQSS